MPNANSFRTEPKSSSHAGARPDIDGAQGATRLPMPVPLLFQLLRPLETMDDVESLAAQLDCARARGCF